MLKDFVSVPTLNGICAFLPTTHTCNLDRGQAGCKGEYMYGSSSTQHPSPVPGTPISASLGEMQGLCEFLAYEPYYHSPYWRALLQTPYDIRRPAGVVAFRQLLQGVLLRRTKASVSQQLALPPCVWEDLPVVLSTAERACYTAIERRYLQSFHQLDAVVSWQGCEVRGRAGFVLGDRAGFHA